MQKIPKPLQKIPRHTPTPCSNFPVISSRVFVSTTEYLYLKSLILINARHAIYL